MAFTDFINSSRRKIQSFVNPTLSPLGDNKSIDASLKNVANDVASAVRITPAGDLAKRAMWARYKQQPPISYDDYLNALRVVGGIAKPEVPVSAFVTGALTKSVINRANNVPSGQDMIATGIESARNAAPFAPLFASQWVSTGEMGNKMVKKSIIESFFKR